MNFVDGVLHIESFLAITLGIIVIFAILHYATQVDVSFDYLYSHSLTQDCEYYGSDTYIFFGALINTLQIKN